MEKNYEVKNGRVISKSGIPLLPRWFTDDLVSVQADEYGISAIQYFNSETMGSEKVFVADMWGGIKFFIDDCGEKNAYNFADTQVMPYGFSAIWKYNKSSFKFEQRVMNNSLFISIEPIECGDDELKLSLEFYDEFCMLPRKDGDFRFVSNIERAWKEWEFKDDVLLNSYREENGETHIAIKSNRNTEYIVRAKGFKKHILNFSGIDKNKIVVAVAFDNNETGCIKRADEMLKNYQKHIDRQNSRYDNVIKKAPVLKSPYKALNDFFSIAPLYHEANKVLSVPGAVRAKTETYWMWGWDGMSSSYAYAYWGDRDFIEKLLKIYMETADEEKGIGHWFARNMTHIETSMISAQGFYISLLYQYYINGGDISPFYDFAKKIFNLIKSVEVDELGLCSGNSLVPDFREVILEN